MAKKAGGPGGEKPTAELYLKNIQAETGHGGRRRGNDDVGGRPWNSNWSFPWMQDWWDNWWNPTAQLNPVGNSVVGLLSRSEPFGGIVYNPATKAVYRVNKSGLELLHAIQSGMSLKEAAAKFKITQAEAETFLNLMLQ